MKDRVRNIRSKLSPIADGDWDNEMYVIDRAKEALIALAQLEAMVGGQEPVAWVDPVFLVEVQADGGAMFVTLLKEEAQGLVSLYRAVPVAQQPQYPLPDDLYPSKDWAAGSYSERVAWLHTMYEGQKALAAEYERQLAQQPQAKIVCPNCWEPGFVEPQAEAVPVASNICRLITPDEYADAVERFRHKASHDKETFKDEELAAFVAHLLDLARSRINATPQQAEAVPEIHDALCPALTGGGCTCTPPAIIDKAWARFCGGIGRGPDAPYPGMIEAFEAHYGQSFTDKDWREETGVWAAAWKAAKVNEEAAAQQAEAVPSDVVRDAERLDYLQKMGATVELLPGIEDFYPMRFRVGGWHASESENIRDAIDAAIAQQKGQRT